MENLLIFVGVIFLAFNIGLVIMALKKKSSPNRVQDGITVLSYPASIAVASLISTLTILLAFIEFFAGVLFAYTTQRSEVSLAFLLAAVISALVTYVVGRFSSETLRVQVDQAQAAQTTAVLMREQNNELTSLRKLLEQELVHRKDHAGIDETQSTAED